jgi:flagellar protein FlaF
MQGQAAEAYRQSAKRGAAPRDLEASLLTHSAALLQRVRDHWGENSELAEALAYNRKLWSVFLAAVTKPDSQLPKPVKQNVANLGLFVMNHTIEVQASPSADKLDVLIAINRQLAAGLRAAQQ